MLCPREQMGASLVCKWGGGGGSPNLLELSMGPLLPREVLVLGMDQGRGPVSRALCQL